MIRGAVVLGALWGLGAGCATAPTHMYDLMDAADDDERESALVEASRTLADGGQPLATRQAAALALGRLQSDDPRAVRALEAALAPRHPPALRQHAAHALGELRSPACLPVLQEALRSRIDDDTGGYVLEALAKHYPIMAGDDDVLVSVVEAMVFYAGNRRTPPPAIYHLLGARTRTVAVNTRVLEGAIERAARGAAPERAAMYNATLELLDRLAARQAEILAGPQAWAARVSAAVQGARRAMDATDPDTALLVIWYLGHLAAEAELARPSATALAGPEVEEARRPTRAARAAQRLVAAWALARMQVHALGPRQALLLDLLSRELEPHVLRALADLEGAPGELDLLQRILGVTGGEKP